MDKNLPEVSVPIVEPIAGPIVGSWRLVSFQRRKGSGEMLYPFGEDAEGLLIYTARRRFSVQLMRRARPLFVAGDQLSGTAEEIKASYEGCIAYYGSYELHPEAGFVVHQVERSLFPNWEGQSLTRFYALSGNRLELTTPPTVWGGAEVVGTLKWERME